MSQETMSNQSSISSPAELIEDMRGDKTAEERIDLMELATILLGGKRIILRSMLIATALGAIFVYLILKPTYTAQAIFIPPQNSPGSGMSQLTNQLGSLGAVGMLSGIKNSGDVYIGILESRTIADSLIRQFDLQKVYKLKKVSDAEKKLKKSSKFISGKDTLITISVDDHDPKRAADLANGYLDSLHVQNERLALTEAAQRRLFFEEQLEREKNALADAEVEMKKTQEQTGLIAPNGQAQVEIESMAQIRAQISSYQIELAAMRQGATDQNPQVVRLQTQIVGLQQQLKTMQSNPAKRQPGNVQLSTAKVPELVLEYIRKQREVKYHEVLFELLAKQYESARLDESRESPLLQVVDRAVVPDTKSGLPKMLILLVSSLLGAFVGVIWVIFRSFIVTLKKDPINAKKLQSLQKAASLKR